MARFVAVNPSRIFLLTVFVWVATFSSLNPTPTYALGTDASPQSFTYQGYLTDNSGNPLTGVNALVIGIYDPTGSCLLYEENDSVDLTSTSGVFSVLVGTQVGDPKRTFGVDPG